MEKNQSVLKVFVFSSCLIPSWCQNISHTRVGDLNLATISKIYLIKLCFLYTQHKESGLPSRRYTKIVSNRACYNEQKGQCMWNHLLSGHSSADPRQVNLGKE